MDLIGRFSVSLTEKFKTSFALHLFKSNTDYKLLNSAKTKDFGFEGDLLLNYSYNENVIFEGGFSLFLPGEIFKKRKGKNISTRFYMMAMVNL